MLSYVNAVVPYTEVGRYVEPAPGFRGGQVNEKVLSRAISAETGKLLFLHQWRTGMPF